MHIIMKIIELKYKEMKNHQKNYVHSELNFLKDNYGTLLKLFNKYCYLILFFNMYVYSYYFKIYHV